LRRETAAVAGLCEQAAARFRARHPKRELRVHLDPDLPAIEVDPTLLRRAVDNLLENAHKYSPDVEQPVFLEGRLRPGRRVAGRVTGVEIAVLDRGMGIPAEDLPRVFEPFFRGERSRSRAAGGVGLGLTLTRRIVEAHGGTIEVSSAPGVGTSARIRLDATRSGGTLEENEPDLG
jgi:signal transduction histidine kinase